MPHTRRNALTLCVCIACLNIPTRGNTCIYLTAQSCCHSLRTLSKSLAQVESVCQAQLQALKGLSEQVVDCAGGHA